MRQRKGIVLFTTILLIMALLGVVMVFLNSTKRVKDTLSYEYAQIQSNIVMYNLVEYFNGIKFDEDVVFYGSGLPFTMEFGDAIVTLEFNSAHDKININNLINIIKTKDNIAYDNFVTYLYSFRIIDPLFFIDILIDTIDKDNIEKNSGNGSEIVLKDPLFRNGRIYNNEHFKRIVEYYLQQTDDEDILKVPFDTFISFDAPNIDINFASKKILEILFYDANSFALETISKHNDIYDKLDDLPFDDYYLKNIKKGRFGQSITTTSNLLDVKVELNFNGRFKSNIKFLYDIKNKKLSQYTVEDIDIF